MPDERTRMRAGLSAALGRVGGVRRLSGTSLVALLCSAALAPVAAAAGGVGPVVLAGMGVVGSVGANVLADMATGVVERLQGDGVEVSLSSVEAELAVRLEDALQGQDESAAALREAAAGLLREIDAVGVVAEAAAHDQDLLPAVAEGFAGLGTQFGEFGSVLHDLRRVAWELEEKLRQQQAVSRAQQERAREHGLTLLRVLEIVERSAEGTAGPRSEGVTAGGEPLWRGCPYVGLMPFEERDARIFYGRKELVGQLVQRLAERLCGGGMLLVAGASGAGKSSLLRAGVMPRLAAGALGQESGRWPRRVMRPTGSPLRELAVNLADLAGVDPVSIYQSLLAAPGEAPLLVEKALGAAASVGLDGGLTAAEGATSVVAPRLVLVVDQFEELFIADEDNPASQAERDAFVAALHAAASVPAGPARVPAALVVVALRADFLDRVIVYPQLAAAVDAGVFPVGPMSEAELRLTITGPAAEAGLIVEPELIGTVIAELSGECADGGLGAGALPLMSQAMAATWEQREDGVLSIRAYRRAGGVADAVNRGAQAAYDTLTNQQQDTARTVFTQLTVITSDGKLARRQCNRADLYAPAHPAGDIDAVVGIFAARRLLVLADTSVEISHDVLLQAWKQLREWLAEDHLGRALHSQVVSDAHLWDTNQRAPSYLYQPGRLAEIATAATRWAATPTHYPPLAPTAVAFLDAAHRAARRTIQRRRAVITGLLALTLTAITAAAAAALNAATANRQHAIALSRQLAASSLVADSTDFLTARQLAVAAWDASPTGQARSAMTTLLTEQQRDSILPAGPYAVSGVAFSPDGNLLASADRDGTVRLWDPATGQSIGAPLRPGNGGAMLGVAFSPDGKLLASADGDGTVRLWNPAAGRTAGAPLLASQTGAVNGVAFSPDGKLLASADGDGTVRLWNPATHQLIGTPLHANPHRLSASNGGVTAVAFSPDGKLLASAGDDGTVRLWNPATGQPIGTPIRADTAGSVTAVAFSPDGKLLASAGDDGTVRLWNPATGQPVGHPLSATTGVFVNGVAFSPDGKLLASAGDDGTVRLWNPATGQPVGHPLSATTGSPVQGVAFSPDGNLLASADGDVASAGGNGGTVQLWNPATGHPAGTPLPASHNDAVNVVAFSPDGKLLASGGDDGMLRLWNPATGQPMGPPLITDGPSLEGVTFSPDSKLLASTAVGSPVQFWNPASGQPLHLISSSAIPSLEDVAFSPDSKLLAITHQHGPVQLWNPITGRLVRVISSSNGGSIDGMVFSPDGNLLAITHQHGPVQLWNPITGRLVRVISSSNGGSIDGMVFSPDGNLLAITHQHGPVQSWNPITGRLVRVISSSNGGSIDGMVFSPDGNLLAGVARHDAVRLWNPITGQPVGARIPANPDSVNDLALSPDGKLLASADLDGTVRLWNTTSGQAVGAPIPASATGGVDAVEFSPDGKLLASADNNLDHDGTVEVWTISLFTNPYATLCKEAGPPTRQTWNQYAPGEQQPRVCA